MRGGPDLRAGDSKRHVKVKQRGSVLNMLRRLDRIRFRGHKRDDFLDLAESPNASDTECGDETPLKIPRTSPRDSDELKDPPESCVVTVERLSVTLPVLPLLLLKVGLTGALRMSPSSEMSLPPTGEAEVN
ncbi:GRAM domain-containing protein 4-like [Physeter macrocephalus]|uniref:GRAM domain-containing protein 4-like n=1 Tax=Physeter macrocephalus TaxID=9755 RepID=A0A9W2WQV1_PHYMC|nr:GRAM domain-containing protein 4-like [Physeter catodon]